MCKPKKQNMVPNFKPGQNTTSPVGDVEAFKQKLRIKLLEMIIENGKDVLFDPLAKPLDNAIPYISAAEAAQIRETNAHVDVKNDDVASIKPELDDVLPLPAKKKKKASDLLNDTDTEVDKNQITIDEAIQEASIVPQVAPVQAETQQTQPAPVHIRAQASEAKQEKESEAKEEPPTRRTIAEALSDYLDKRHKAQERKDYFASLYVQVKNKNAVCYELLKFLDEE